MFCISPLYKEVLIIFFYMQALRSNNYFYINLLSVRLLNKKFTVRLVNNRFISIRRYFSSFPSRSLFTINYIPVSSLPPVFTSYELIAKSFSTKGGGVNNMDDVPLAEEGSLKASASEDTLSEVVGLKKLLLKISREDYNSSSAEFLKALRLYLIKRCKGSSIGVTEVNMIVLSFTRLFRTVAIYNQYVDVYNALTISSSINDIVVGYNCCHKHIQSLVTFIGLDAAVLQRLDIVDKPVTCVEAYIDGESPCVIYKEVYDKFKLHGSNMTKDQLRLIELYFNCYKISCIDKPMASYIGSVDKDFKRYLSMNFDEGEYVNIIQHMVGRYVNIFDTLKDRFMSDADSIIHSVGKHFEMFKPLTLDVIDSISPGSGSLSYGDKPTVLDLMGSSDSFK